MAEIFPDEGLDAILTIVPKNGTNEASTGMFLFTGGTASTVPGASAVLASGIDATFDEATGTDYARQAIAAASWGSITAGTGGRKVTAGQVTFPTVGSGGWGTITGFGISDGTTAGSGIAYFYANFDDTTAITSAQNDVIKITPTWQINN